MAVVVFMAGLINSIDHGTLWRMYMKYQKIVVAILAMMAALLFMTRCDFHDAGEDNIARSLFPLAQDTETQDCEIPEEKLIACKADGDCVMARKDCCGCSMGGTSFSINKKYQDYWQDRMNKKCGGIACPAVYVCGVVENQCVENKCVLVEIKL